MKILWMTSTMASLALPSTKHPMSMGLILIMQTLIIAMIGGLKTDTYWFFYLLIMAMISGLLILFAYMASTAANEKFNFPSIPATMLMCTPLMMLLTEDQMEAQKIWSSENMESYSSSLYSLCKLFAPLGMFLTIALACWMMAMMIIVSYLSNRYEGALRQSY